MCNCATMADDVNNCNVCCEAVLSMEKLKCFGCRNLFHVSCTNVLKTHARIFAEVDYAAFICEDCRTKEFIIKKDENEFEKKEKKDDVVKVTDLMESMKDLNLIKSSLLGLKKDIKKIVKDEVSNAMNSRRPVTRSQSCSISGEPTADKIAKKRKFVDLGEKDDDVFVDNGLVTTPTFSEIVKGKKRSITVKIKANAENQKNFETRADVQGCVENPEAIEMQGLRNRKNGEIQIDCGSSNGAEKLKMELSENFGEKYDVFIEKPRRPRVKILGFSREYSNEDLIDRIKLQNKQIDLGEMIVLKRYENVNMNYSKYNAIFEVDPKTFKNIMSVGKVYIGYEKCRVVECFGILRCFKCCGFGHKQNECRSENVICPKCAGGHKKSECVIEPSESNKCTNCIKYRDKRGLNLDCNHNAYSYSCPVYQHFISQKINRIDYE